MSGRQQKAKGTKSKAYANKEVIGRGAFGVIYKANYVPADESVILDVPHTVALKVMKVTRKTRVGKVLHKRKNEKLDRKKVLEEFSLQQEVHNCRFVVRLFDIVHLPSEIWGVMEYAEIGSLENFASSLYLMVNVNKIEALKKPSDRNEAAKHKSVIDVNALPLPEVLVRWFLAPVVLAIRHLHAHGIAHLDIKQDNVLLFNNGMVKLTDFGSSVRIADYEQGKASFYYDGLQHWYGTEGYQPPEAFTVGENKTRPGICPISVKADIWSIGITALDLFMGRSPWSLKKVDHMRILPFIAPKDEKGKSPEAVWSLEGLYQHFQLDKSVKENTDKIDGFAKFCLKLYNDRPSAERLCRHAYLRDNVEFWNRINEDYEPDLTRTVDINWIRDVKGRKSGKLEDMIWKLVEDTKQTVVSWLGEETTSSEQDDGTIELRFLDGNNRHDYDPDLMHICVISLIEQCIEFKSREKND